MYLNKAQTSLNHYDRASLHKSYLVSYLFISIFLNEVCYNHLKKKMCGLLINSMYLNIAQKSLNHCDRASLDNSYLVSYLCISIFLNEMSQTNINHCYRASLQKSYLVSYLCISIFLNEMSQTSLNHFYRASFDNLLPWSGGGGRSTQQPDVSLLQQPEEKDLGWRGKTNQPQDGQTCKHTMEDLVSWLEGWIIPEVMHQSNVKKTSPRINQCFI